MKIKNNYVLRTVANEHIVVPIGTEAVNFNGVLSLKQQVNGFGNNYKLRHRLKRLRVK
jgi:hypothetical protein